MKCSGTPQQAGKQCLVFSKIPGLFSSILYYVRVSAAWHFILYLLVRSQFITRCECIAGLYYQQSAFVWSCCSVGMATAS